MEAEVVYTTPWGQTYTTDSYGQQMAGQSSTFDPGTDDNVQNGCTVQLKAAVVWGSDKTASEQFQYEPGNTNTANYVSSGITLDNTLKY